MIGVTGVNGFIGSCLAEFLRKTQHDVIELSTNPQKKHIVKLVEGVPLENIKKGKSMIHCGGLVGNGFEKQEYIYANVECTEKLLGWCEKHQVEQFVLFSTGGIYGAHKEWLDETACINPSGYYAESKVLAEERLMQSNIPIKTIVRLYFPIGDFQYKHLFSKLAHDLLSNNEVFLNDKQGHPCISPIHVSDICCIISRICNNKIGGIYNISANIGITIGEIVDMMSALYEISPEKNIRDSKSENYLGKADKVILATGYDSFISPQEALRGIIKGKLSLI